MEQGLSRRLWRTVETVNAVTYFAPECREAPGRLGLEGFWAGYFACRAAPMGAVPPGVVEATFHGFAPRRVRNAIPAAWGTAEPQVLVQARSAAAAAALRRLLGEAEVGRLAARLLPTLLAAVEHGRAPGKALFAANRDVRPDDDLVRRLWQAATTLREHRGDCHVALLVEADLDGCEAHVLFAADEQVPAELYLRSRGWSAEAWGEATGRLAARHLLEADGSISRQGRSLRRALERRTDELAWQPYERHDEAHLAELVRQSAGAVRSIAGSGEVPFPNPMGLPAPDDEHAGRQPRTGGSP